jgi:peptide-methionine (S)-S-oxide reductase
LHGRSSRCNPLYCSWKPSEELTKVPGVTDTVVGYTGVKSQSVKEAPTYDTVCYGRNWVEGVRVYFDDEQVSYAELLDAFFEAQEPKFRSRQYASIIFPHDPEQEETAKEWLAKNGQNMRSDGVTTAWTQIEELSPFFKAESYHQRYWQKTRPRFATMIALTAVASGILDRFVPETLWAGLHSCANALVLAGLLYVLVERKIDTKTVEI